ncbi:MAG: MGMT family protein [Gemmatimonadaceae bacterium]
MKTATEESVHARIRAVVSRIPRGRVATYGQIARLAGLPGQARLVGYALHALPRGSMIPWHRVINARGQITTPAGSDTMQRRLLETENIRFGTDNRVNLDTFLWKPRRVLR